MPKRKALAAIVAALALGILLFNETLLGLTSPFFPWKEDAFVGHPRSEMEAELSKTGRYLTATRPHVWYFTKGREYSIGLGTAINAGFVTFTTNGAGIQIVEHIEHGSFVDSL
jgi:hypothetical protein